jgi:hypothetical protein
MKKILGFVLVILLNSSLYAQEKTSVRAVELKSSVYSFETLLSKTGLRPISGSQELRDVYKDVMQVPELFGLSPTSSIFFVYEISGKLCLSEIRWKEIDARGTLIVQNIKWLSINIIPKGSIIMGY